MISPLQIEHNQQGDKMWLLPVLTKALGMQQENCVLKIMNSKCLPNKSIT